MNNPKITVCIPAYNRASLLPELLDSVFSQEFEDYEVLIAEDFSPERDAIRAVNYVDRFRGALILLRQVIAMRFEMRHGKVSWGFSGLFPERWIKL